MKASKTFRRSRPAGAPERLLLGTALLVPLAVVTLAMTQLPSVSLASSWSLTSAGSSRTIVSQRPVGSNPAPPPTLAPPTFQPKPITTPVPPKLAATPQKSGFYVVQPGDELKAIAAGYNVSIWKIIAANNLANPDSLRIGQELRIPSE